jgi:hypothetical protein
MRTLVGRTDLRLHRKIVIVDGEVAWTGSMNLVDPRYFKKGAGVGEWVDAGVRLEGAVVIPLGATMIGDWMLETGEAIPDLIRSAGLHLVQPQGPADVQVIPSGPGEVGGNAGSDFAIQAFTDSSAAKGYPLVIQRSSGRVFVGGTSTIPGGVDGNQSGLTVNRNATGPAVQVTNTASGGTGMGAGAPSTRCWSTPTRFATS